MQTPLLTLDSEDPLQLLVAATEITQYRTGCRREKFESSTQALLKWVPNIISIFPDIPFDWMFETFCNRVRLQGIIEFILNIVMMNDEDFQKESICLKSSSLLELRRICQNLNQCKTWKERTSWFPTLFQEANLYLISNSPLIINDHLKLGHHTNHSGTKDQTHWNFHFK